MKSTIDFGPPKLDPNSFHPQMEIIFHTHVSLDRQEHSLWRMHRASAIDLLVDEYKAVLEKQLPKMLKKYDIDIWIPNKIPNKCAVKEEPYEEPYREEF